MLKLADRVKETSITIGNGLEIALAGAFGAFQTFASTIGDGNSTYYTIENNSNFEVGVGTYNASNNTLSRDLVLSSTSNNQRISLDGVSIVFCCYPASQAVLLDNGRINSPSPNYNGIVFPSSTVIDTALLSGVVSESILPTSVVYSDDIRLSDNRNPNPHTHTISDITALQNALDSKQPTGSYASSVHSHVVSDVQGLQTALDNKQAAGSYAASSHTHTSSQITDFAAAVSSVAPPTTNANLLTAGTLSDDRLSNNIVRTSDSRLSDARTPLSHSHSISDVTNLQSSLDSKQASGNYAASSHTHAISSVSGLQSALDGKQPSGSYAALSHTHTSSNITDFNSSVSGLVSGIYAPLSSPTLTGVPLTPTASSGTNTNQIASTSFVRNEISNLVASAPSTLDTLNELATALGNDPNFATTVTNSLANKAALAGASFTGAIASPSGSFTSSLKVNNTDVSLNGHGHSVSDISGLQTSLDGKQPSGSYASLSHTHSIANVSGLQTALDNKQPSGNYLTSHPSVSAASSSDNFGNTFIQDLLVDSYGHVTGISTATANSPSSVSISNYANNRLLTSDGTSSGIYAESGITFDGSQLKLNDAEIFLEYNDPENNPTFFKRNQITSAQIGLVSEYSISAGAYNSAGMSSEDISISYNEQGLDIPIQTSYYTSITKNNLSFYKTLYDNTNAGVELSSSIMTVNSSGIIFTDGSTLDSANHNHSIANVSGLQTALDGKQPSGSYAALSHNHVIADVTGLQTALDGKQPSGSYAASSHTHTSSSITDFNSSVSGLLSVKNISASSYINIVSNTGNYTISVTGLQPSGSYASSAHIHSISDVTGLQTALDAKQASGNYASSSHTHTSSDISDSTTAGRALLTGSDASTQRTSLGLGTIATQASGNYALTSHTHTASNITDFNSSVSGILPVKNLTAGTNIQIVSTTGNYTINVSGISSGSTSASDLTGGTLNDARLSFTPIHPFLLFGG